MRIPVLYIRRSLFSAVKRLGVAEPSCLSDMDGLEIIPRMIRREVCRTGNPDGEGLKTRTRTTNGVRLASCCQPSRGSRERVEAC